MLEIKETFEIFLYGIDYLTFVINAYQLGQICFGSAWFGSAPGIFLTARKHLNHCATHHTYYQRMDFEFFNQSQ